MSNFMFSKLMGYEGNLSNYILSGGLGAAGGAALGAATGQRIKFYSENLDAFGDALEKIDNHPNLEKWHQFQRMNPVMKPVRQAAGRVVTNIKAPVGYDVSDMKKIYKEHGIKGILQAAVKDEPLYDLKKYTEGGETIQAREPAQRAYFDLPSRLAPGKEDSIYIKGDDKRWQFNPHGIMGRKLLMETYPRSEEKPLTTGGTDVTAPKGKGATGLYEDVWSAIEAQPPRMYGSHGTLGGFSFKRDPKTGELIVGDPFDFKTKISQKTRADQGYSSMKVPYAGKERERKKALEKVIHHSRNIIDRMIGSPVTIEARIPGQRPAPPPPPPPPPPVDADYTDDYTDDDWYSDN
jgi:hypothetical protein